MKVVVVASRKGGVGKTTLTVNLAAVASQTGKTGVAIVDLDPQGSSTLWSSIRQGEAPKVLSPSPRGFKAMLDELESQGIGLVFVDTAPIDNKFAAEVIDRADFVVVPTRPSPLDFHGVGATLQNIGASEKPMAFVVNGASARAHMVRTVVDALKLTAPVAPVVLHDRTEFVFSMGEGKAVTESHPRSKSAKEVHELWSYIKGRLSKVR